MLSYLDLDLQRAFAALMAPGAMLEVAPVPVERFGVSLPMLVRAPPALPPYFAHFCAQHGDATFLVDGEVRLSFAQAYAAARAAAGGLVGHHRVQPGEFVGLAARNSANWVVAYMAVLMAGGCATLLNGWWQGTELVEGIRHGPCRLVIADDERARRMAGLDHGAELLALQHGCAPAEGLAALGSDPAAVLPEPKAGDHATMLFTSGSTGKAKGALSDHRGVMQGTMSYIAQTMAVLGAMSQRGFRVERQPAALVNVPLFHVTGEVPVLLQSFALGRKLVLMPKWDPVEAMRLIERERITYFVGVPLMSYEIATHPERDRYDLSSCLTYAAGGAPRPVEHVHRIREALPHGFPILGYGLTETNGVGCGNFNENYLAKPGSTGRASPPLVELAVFNEGGAPLPQGEVGEIGIRTIANFIGYWGDEAATAAAFTADGFFRTGDLGYLDGDGYLFIVDRKKDIIIRGGENISSAEVEGAIYTHPDVAEASVFAVPDPRLGEVPAAVFVAKEGRALAPEGLRTYLAGQLAPFKVPALIWRVEQPLPRLGTEKVDKRSLRLRYAASLRQES
ncbi:MAG: class I adenylate-forming enzyme family protein [Novosphingobium sp.]